MKKKHLLTLIFILLAGLLLTACGGGESYSPETIASGQENFVSSCSACHGEDGTGIEGIDINLNNNTFVQSKSDEDLVAYVLDGRSVDDPLNSTGIEMPPKGGNPALATEQIEEIVAFLISLQGE